MKALTKERIKEIVAGVALGYLSDSQEEKIAERIYAALPEQKAKGNDLA